MADTQHTDPTPTPWKTEGDGLWMLVRGADSTIVAVRHRLPAVVHEANAAHIVKCVNAHTALVVAVEGLLYLCEHGDFSNANTDPTNSIDEGTVLSCGIMRQARAALALAGSP